MNDPASAIKQSSRSLVDAKKAVDVGGCKETNLVGYYPSCYPECSLRDHTISLIVG
jgi:hypothetical protein